MTASPVAAVPLVKICGVREAHHARVAAQAGAAMVGLVFAASRRRVGVEEARAVTGASYAVRPRFVGVFVNESAAEMERIAAAAGLDAAQLSGDEPPEGCAALRLPYYKVIHVQAGTTAADVLARAVRYPGAAAIVLDAAGAPSTTIVPEAAGAPAAAPGASRWGGTGLTVDPDLAAEVVRRLDRPVMLAGGLRPESVGEAVRRVRPWAVDVSSGVETNGIKDDALIAAFVAAASYQPSASLDYS